MKLGIVRLPFTYNRFPRTDFISVSRLYSEICKCNTYLVLR